MNENMNTPTKWLKYLLYVGIAALVNSLLGAALPGRLSTWLGYAISAASIYLMFRLIGSNGRYQKAAIFSGVALVVNLLGIQLLSLVGSVCAIVGQYQEYHAHGELVAERDSQLARKWSSLFWIQFAVELIGGLLITMVVAVMATSGELDSAPIIAIATVAASFVAAILRVLYLVYLNRTVKAMETEFVAEGVE